MNGTYNTSNYRKHKRPKGWGSLCPDDVDPQGLLDAGVKVGRVVFNVDERYAYRAAEHEPGEWHGHPIPWSRLPNEARVALIETGRLDNKTWLKAIRKSWGSEFE